MRKRPLSGQLKYVRIKSVICTLYLYIILEYAMVEGDAIVFIELFLVFHV